MYVISHEFTYPDCRFPSQRPFYLPLSPHLSLPLCRFVHPLHPFVTPFHLSLSSIDDIADEQ